MEVKELIKKYNLQAVEKDGKMMVHTRARVPAKDVAAIKEHREEILKEILDAKEQEKRSYQERQAKIKAIPGLAEIKAELEKAADWRRRFSASFGTEDGGGWGVGPRPQYDFEAAYKKYPQAHAYLIAEKEAYKSNLELAEIGRRALEKVINGQWEEAMDELKCGVGYTEEDGPDTLMDRCAAALDAQYVEDEDGRTVDYAAAVELMDDDLREQLHREMAPCSNQEFYAAYAKAHAAKFGEKFQIN